MSDARDDLLGLADGRLAIGFVLHSLRRHSWLATAVLALGSAATATAFLLVPRTYHTEVRLLAQRNLVMPALGNPRRTVPVDSDAPTRLAAETVMKRENLLSVIRATRLGEEWERDRTPLLKLKDRALQPLVGAPTDEDNVESLVGLLRKKVFVGADEGTVTIGIDWRNAATACRIVEQMQQNFLEERHATEVSSIADAISILEGHAAGVRRTIESTLDEVRRSPPAPARSGAPPGRPAPSTASDAALVQLEVLLSAKRRAIADLEEFRQKRVAELYALLAEQKNTYGPSHPAITGTEQSIQALSSESPQIAALRREEGELREQIRRRVGGERPEPGPAAEGGPSRRVAAAGEPTPEGLGGEPAPDSPVSYARSRLKSAIAEYEDLLERLEGARIELDTARAAFKYRYGVVSPAQVPKRPVSPTPLSFFVLGLGFSLALALAGAVVADLGHGRILEPWQVERFLGLPLLGEVTRP